LQAVIGTVFNEAVRLMVRAFERRAYALYRRSAPQAAAPAEPAPTA
jgi:coenzyme Q-binding protein COQ10